ncbi:hypothetical protein NQ315_005876 [Exocentrus adspersus]|uniref:Sepiapterin reductase n=1 Tax=Exocentrus adspersus TaxID=1586481 RepID=A0AAV8VRK8_9CUCU|nr:hypothetical protein NQ315_005876 [Exocentrus adspersus]
MACSVNFNKKSIIFITGASKGIGRTIAVELSRRLDQNSILILIARSVKGLDETKAQILMVDKSITVQTHALDLSNPDLNDYNKLFQNILASIDTSGIEFGFIFHNAGHIGTLKQTIDLTDLTTWREYYDLNLFSVALLNSVFIKQIRPVAPQLVIVNITSLCGRSPTLNLAMYGSGKAARELFFKVLAVEEPKIIVLNYSPGPVKTEMFESIIAEAQSEVLKKSFQEVKDTTVLSTEQTVSKLLDVLEKGDFKTDTYSEMSPLMFLLNLAWDCRYRLPLLITVGFMVLDVRMQLDINVQTRRIPRPRTQPRPLPEQPVNHEDDIREDDISDDSWTTTAEETVTDLEEY